jgi:predicted Rossmann fold nucleotide-binding protein DprA/Smf involved in DNA uptake
MRSVVKTMNRPVPDNCKRSSPDCSASVLAIQEQDKDYPSCLRGFLEADAPETIFARGDMDILGHKRIALFCSIKCPGEQILKAYDIARALRDAGKTIISGFHSPMEKECLTLLLRGEQPIIICPARGLEKMRLPADWKKAMAAGRLLLLSPFPGRVRRVTADLARQRNLFVAAMADEACFVHTTPGGNLEKLKVRVLQWGIPILTL